jgi:RNA polymerase sigma-70 factor (ECF subfamily)
LSGADFDTALFFVIPRIFPTGMLRENQITELLARKDQAAIALIYDYYAPALYGTILRIVRSEAVAEDVLQDTLVKVWRYADRYNAQQGRLFTWLINIARNTAIDAYRSKAYRQQSENQGLEIAVDQVGHFESTDHIGLRELLQTIDPKHRELIDLAYFQGYTQTEIAEELQLPLGTVKTRMRSALQSLRGKFDTASSGRAPSGTLFLLLGCALDQWEKQTDQWQD